MELTKVCKLKKCTLCNIQTPPRFVSIGWSARTKEYPDTLTPKNFGGTNFRIFFCPNIYPPKFCKIRNFFRPKFLVFRFFYLSNLGRFYLSEKNFHLRKSVRNFFRRNIKKVSEICSAEVFPPNFFPPKFLGVNVIEV